MYINYQTPPIRTEHSDLLIFGEPHLDQNSGDQVNAANVIVVLAEHVQDPEICEQIINGICTAYSVEIDLMGGGPAILFRDGKRYDGSWTRNNRCHFK